MKKTIFLLAFLSPLLLSSLLLSAQQVTVQGDAKVGIIVTGTGNVINTTQIFGKSPEYAELKKRLDGLAALIAKKAGECEQMAKDSLPQKYRDGCRAELIALNAERDSVQKIETRFRDDVIRLAETFSKIPLNSHRLFVADSLFKEGKIREAETLLNYKEITQEGDALLVKKERQAAALQETDSLLLIKANELALKARLKATDYSDPLRYDSAEWYFQQSLRFAESMDNLRDFGFLLYEDNQALRATGYYERALQLTPSEDEEALLCRNLGVLYKDVQKMAESEKMYLRALEIYERLVKSSPEVIEPDLALTLNNLGNLKEIQGQLEEAEKFYLRAMEIYERLAKSNPAQFEPELTEALGYHSWFYLLVKKFNEAQVSAERTLALDPSQKWVLKNLGHSYLLRGEWEKAKLTYEQYIAGEKDSAEAKATLLKDWDDLEAAGVIPKERMSDVEKARKWARE